MITKLDIQREKNRILIMAILLAVSCFLIYYFHVVLKEGTVFTHFFYIPIILASIWWKRKGLVVALFLAVLIIFSYFFIRTNIGTISDLYRSFIFIAVSLVAAFLSEKIWKAEQKVRELNQAIEQSLEGIATADIDGKFTFVNQTWAEMHGYQVADLIGKPVAILDSPADRENLPKIWEEIKEKGVQILTEAVQCTRSA